MNPEISASNEIRFSEVSKFFVKISFVGGDFDLEKMCSLLLEKKIRIIDFNFDEEFVTLNEINPSLTAGTLPTISLSFG